MDNIRDLALCRVLQTFVSYHPLPQSQGTSQVNSFFFFSNTSFIILNTQSIFVSRWLLVTVGLYIIVYVTVSHEVVGEEDESKPMALSLAPSTLPGKKS